MDRNEIRRLQKAARDNNKLALGTWAAQFETSLRSELEREYEKSYKEEIADSIDNFLLAVAYTCHFSEDTKLDADTLPDFMEDLFVTINMFRLGEYKPEDYKEELEKCGIFSKAYSYRSTAPKIVTFIGNDKDIQNGLCKKGYIVLHNYKNDSKEIKQHKILMSDIVYVLVKDLNNLTPEQKQDIAFAKSKHREIRYFESE